MPDDRRPRGGSSSGDRRGAGGRGRSGPGGRSGGRSVGRRSDGRRPDGRAGNRRGSGGQRSPGRSDGRSEGRRSEEREPRTEAERRAAAVRATRGPRRTPRTPDREREQIESRETETWLDEGSVRAEAEAATRRAGGRARHAREVDPDVIAEIHDAVDSRRAGRLAERLASASAALDRERFDEARRMVAPLVRELPQVAAVHEVSGLASYRLGRWRQAAQSLELARQLRPDPSLLPVLADCYRAQKRWSDVDAVWNEVKSASPPHEVMAEARIVAASALADRGELKSAIELLQAAQKAPKRVRDHHLRQWYVLADLYDRAGDTVTAARWFREIEARDAGFADVRDRLRGLGR